MPHTSRRSRIEQLPLRSAIRNKQKHFQTEDGWTLVSKFANAQQLVPLEPDSNHYSSSSTTSTSTQSFGPNSERPAIYAKYPTVAAFSERLTQAQLRLYISEHPERCAVNGPVLNESSGEILEAPWTPRPQQAIYNLDELRKTYDKVTKQWGNSGCGEVLLARLERGIGAKGLRNLRKGICLGLGSPSADPTGWKSCVMWQVVAFKSIINIIHARCTTLADSALAKISFYAQDPIFNATDEAFLSALDVIVLRDSEAFPRIDGTAFVFAPHFPIALWPAEMRLGRAGLIIGNDIEQAMSGLPDPSALARIFDRPSPPEARTAIPDLHVKTEFCTFLNDHNSIVFPEPKEQDYAFKWLRVYWTKEKEEPNN